MRQPASFDSHCMLHVIIGHASCAHVECRLRASFCRCREPKVLTDATGTVQVTGLRSESVASAAALLAALQRTAERRQTRATARNDVSSRSHAFYRLCFARGGGHEGCITFVDLAGAIRP